MGDRHGGQVLGCGITWGRVSSGVSSVRYNSITLLWTYSQKVLRTKESGSSRMVGGARTQEEGMVTGVYMESALGTKQHRCEKLLHLVLDTSELPHPHTSHPNNPSPMSVTCSM